MPAKIILNPYSNRWGAGQQAGFVSSTLNQLGYAYELVQTTSPEEGIELAKQAVLQGFDPIVAAGGDGTISQVVNGILGADSGTTVRLGIIPLGSANDYAVQLGIPIDIAEACRLLVQADYTRTLDAGTINDRFFMNDITIAFGAQVNIEAAEIKRLRGSLLYLGGVFKALRHFHLPVISYEWDEGKIENRPILLAYVGNGWRTGGVFYLTPDARKDDGLLDFIVADAMGRLTTMRLLPKTFDGSHIHDPRVSMARCTWLHMTSPDPLPVLVDGEIVHREAHELDIRILPKALTVIVGPQKGKRPGEKS